MSDTESSLKDVIGKDETFDFSAMLSSLPPPLSIINPPSVTNNTSNARVDGGPQVDRDILSQGSSYKSMFDDFSGTGDYYDAHDAHDPYVLTPINPNRNRRNVVPITVPISPERSDSPLNSPRSDDSETSVLKANPVATLNFLTLAANCCLADSLVMNDATAKSDRPYAAYMRNVANMAIKMYVKVYYTNDSEFAEVKNRNGKDYLVGHQQLLRQLGYEFSRFPVNNQGFITSGLTISGLFDKLYEDKFRCIEKGLGALKSRDSTEATDKRKVQPKAFSNYTTGDGCLAQKAGYEFIQSDRDNAMNLAIKHVETYILDRFLQVVSSATTVSNDNQCKSNLKQKILDLKTVVKSHHDGTKVDSIKYRQFSADPITVLKEDIVASSDEINEGNDQSALISLFSNLNDELGYLFGISAKSDDLANLHTPEPETKSGCRLM